MNLRAIRSLSPGVHTPRTTYFRVVSESFASTIEDIWPSYDRGWRYNPKKEFGVLYLSISERCCGLERSRQSKASEGYFQPLVIGEFKVSINKCLDLTSSDVLKTISVEKGELLTEDLTLPQSIAREARSSGFEALIVPSAASEECQNLVVFRDKLLPPSFCLLVKTQKL